ncbi:sugar transferase [Butyricimonas hominis]|uniref:Sugar transferase n=1 Tax=Butyricimonas hominis TaxID=2763032 RepID=A0ABR7D2L2_9BACT|nr:sugar transferase [Butyricimonas hominis]MBC5622002.1 sugar transferase [Butyricimonas hominis]
MYNKFFKRLLDILISLCALPFVLLVILIVAPFIYLEDRGSVFYLAKRRGRHGKIFSMYKLRSMVVNAQDIRNKDNSTFNSTSDPRVTKIGELIRKMSIDELPQVFNILKGDMSFIGPRATIPIDGVLYDDLNEVQKKRLDVRPGITGYGQALYRNSIGKEKKQELDCYYVDHVSFILDLKIIFWTIKTVLLRKNLYTNADEEVMLGKE